MIRLRLLATWLRDLFAPRFRIVEAWDSWHCVEFKTWWLPFWRDYGREVYASRQEAERELREELRVLKRHAIILNATQDAA